LANTKASIPSTTLLSFTKGVLPIVPNMFSAYFILFVVTFCGANVLIIKMFTKIQLNYRLNVNLQSYNAKIVIIEF
jgi:hypothetical protein